jgi:hypothetical protein
MVKDILPLQLIYINVIKVSLLNNNLLLNTSLEEGAVGDASRYGSDFGSTKMMRLRLRNIGYKIAIAWVALSIPMLQLRTD